MEANMPFGLVVEEQTDSSEAVQYCAKLEYSSIGDRITVVPNAVIISVNGTEAGRISAPMSTCTWTETIDMTGLITPGQRNDIQVYCETYYVSALGGNVITEASVSVRFGRRKIFDAYYRAFEGRRVTREEVAFVDDRPIP